MWEPTVETVMTREIVTACPGTPVKELVALMAAHRVSGLPVVDEAGRPIGVVTEADALVRPAHLGGTRPRFGQVLVLWRKGMGRIAADLMTTPAMSISVTSSIDVAARLLLAEHHRRLCVVDDDGHLVGVIARRDLISPFPLPQEQA
jgi:CBS domain-containing protein